MTFYSNPIFIPNNQWVNIKITVDQNDGLFVYVYNTNGELQHDYENSRFLGTQRPNNKIKLFTDNFYEGVMSFTWWLDQPDNTQTSQAFLHYHFVKQDSNWINGGTAEVAEIDSTVGNLFSFKNVAHPDSVGTVTPQKAGTFEANEPLYDGTSCTNNDMTTVTIEAGGFLRSKSKIESFNEFTVEFWFKLATSATPTPGSPVDLFSI